MPIAVNPPQWPSLGLLSKQTGIDKAALRYAAQRLGVRPIARVGNADVFTDQDCAEIVRQARRIQQEREVSQW